METMTDRVGLSYIDLLYALPVTELALRASDTHLRDVTAAAWSDVALALTAVTFGWIGHHGNRELKDRTWGELVRPDQPFPSFWLLQFAVEVAIIAAYFAFAARLALNPDEGAGPSEHWKLGLLAALFGLYFVWDSLDIVIACFREKTEWARRAWLGRVVTLAFLILFALGFTLSFALDLQVPVLAFNLATILVLLAYRVVQGRITSRVSLPSPPAPAPECRCGAVTPAAEAPR